MFYFLRQFLKRFFIFLVSVAFLWATYFFLYGNFHKVDKDVYRSAQLFGFNMPYYIQKHHIKSILNLRGESDKSWYHNEIGFAKEHNISHYNFGIPDRKEITLPQMEKMIEIMKNAPKPLLIHCKMGADRTSLAVALYLSSLKDDTDAKSAISIVYGHFPWLGSKTGAMDRSFEAYQTQKP